MSPEEKGFVIHFQRIWDEYLQQVAIKQVKVLSGFDPKETLRDAIDLTKEDFNAEKDLREIFQKRKILAND